MNTQTPNNTSYDVVIIGGAMMGASAAWFLSDDKDFDGNILVVDRDLTYENTSTMHTNSTYRVTWVMMIVYLTCRSVRSGTCIWLTTKVLRTALRESQQIQVNAGAATQLMTPAQIKTAYPFYNVDDIVLGSINLVDEGFWDATAVFDWWRKSARERGVEYIENEVVEITKNATGNRVESVTLKSGDVIACGQVLNASGPRAARTARMAGINVPVEPRKRYSWVFSAEKPLDRDLPLTIDPSGVHVRENGGGTYQCGGHSDIDPAVDYDDFIMDHNIWENHVWPILATRIPQFEAIKVQSEWAGHYAYNTFDHNAILGPHMEVENFFFLNGFSGHGLQQSPAMGRGTAEIMLHGSYKTLDMKQFHFERIPEGRKIIEKAII
ncbi:FAD-dependent oxidoreductase domain-containing protein 1 [Nymphon striatum]|nr:FAD-dependent oxidoreductase domain-containing protein 1 [Nymphon striatum]